MTATCTAATSCAGPGRIATLRRDLLWGAEGITMSQHHFCPKLPARFAPWVGLAALLVCASAASAQHSVPLTPIKQQNPAPPVFATSVTTVVELELADCLHLALQRQPRLAVQRAGLAAAEDGCRALDTLKIPVILDPEIPFRRKQAALGVAIAAANLDLADHETRYSVTRAYFSVLYAREQERVARSVVERLTAIHAAAVREKASMREKASVKPAREREKERSANPSAIIKCRWIVRPTPSSAPASTSNIHHRGARLRIPIIASISIRGLLLRGIRGRLRSYHLRL